MPFWGQHFEAETQPGGKVKLLEIVGQSFSGIGRGHIMVAVGRVGDDVPETARRNGGDFLPDVGINIVQKSGKTVGFGAAGG